MHRGRRGFLVRVLGALPGALLPGAATAAPDGNAADEAVDDEWLAAVAEAIVPADDTPGAGEAGVVSQLRAAFESDEKKARLYGAGRTALDAAARVTGATRFAALSVDDGSRVLQALADDPTTAPSVRAFYFQARADVLGLFYASETGHAAVGYRPPPYAYPAPDESGA